MQDMAFAGGLSTGDTRTVPSLADSEQAQDDAAAMLRHSAHLIQADLVFTIMLSA
jgi:hypothetical protein